MMHCFKDALFRAILKQDGVFVSKFNYVPCRFRYKPKWATNMKKITDSTRALKHFDAFYKPYYGEKWPLIRVSLLSLSKYCAAVNKYSHREQIKEKLLDIGTEDFVKQARSLLEKNSFEEPSEKTDILSIQSVDHIESLKSEIDIVGDSNVNKSFGDLYKPTVQKENTREDVESDRISPEDGQELDPMYDDLYKDNIDVFIPTVKVYSERDMLLRDEMNLNTFEAREVDFQIRQPNNFEISNSIGAFVFPAGDVSDFPSPRTRGHQLGYYLMDASSVLPVVALNIQPNDDVLDICAAPGGKTVLILQCLDFSSGGSLTCNDNSPSRVQRLKNVLRSYLPEELFHQVKVLQGEASDVPNYGYNKVLVDVPCNNDRHVLEEDENNLFNVSRTRERLSLFQKQKHILISAIKLCNIGGHVVYSTCTLAPAQNDGVIQAAMEYLQEKTEIQVVVEDLSTVASMFKDTLTFFDKSRYGQTVIPTLTNNFGPSYFAKLRRIK